jgi:hypothetical protein
VRQAHPAGERIFVDYAGQTVDLIDPGTGEARPAQIFVAVMGASNYTYAEATLTQSLPDWIGAHVRALAFMGGVPAQLVPDNYEGFHHHATLCIAAYGFLISERERIPPQQLVPWRNSKNLPFPPGHQPRGAANPARTAHPQLDCTMRRHLIVALARSLDRCPCSNAPRKPTNIRPRL